MDRAPPGPLNAPLIDPSDQSRAARSGRAQALVYARASDTLVVWRLDRLGRSSPHLLETVTELAERQSGFRSLTEAIAPTDRELEVGFGPSVTLGPLLARGGPRSLERGR